MQFFDMTMLIIWLVVPLMVLIGRALLAAYRTKQIRDRLRETEKKSTPLTRPL